MASVRNESQNEIGKHLLAFAQALYQLCVYCAKMFIVGGKLLFDELYKLIPYSEQTLKTNEPAKIKQQ